MVNITRKSNTLRKAVASAVVLVSAQSTIEAIVEKRVPKGDIFEFAKVAALFAIKKTSEVIPDCHPLPIEYSHISFAIDGLSVKISVEVHTVYKTGVEVEAMHGASIAALTLYDMLKPIDSHVEISTVRLEHKEGGKSSRKLNPGQQFTAAVAVCSDSVFHQKAIDKAGPAVISQLKKYGVNVPQYEVIADEADAITSQVAQHCHNGINILFFVGGTGVSPRDVTPDVVRSLLHRELQGVMEEARRYGQERMPYAMLSRSVAGFVGPTLVLTLPGSTKGALEYLDALFPQILHVFDVASGARHEALDG